MRHGKDQVRIRSLASSSKGNAYLVEQGDDILLIDCGICLRTLRATVDFSRLRGILITHNHADHVFGLKRVLTHADVPVYANEMTASAIEKECDVDGSAFSCFENGQPFMVASFEVTPFSIPHDAADPVGFLVRGDETYFHATDVGTPLDSIGVRLSEADCATLESNHDPEMLRTSRRPPSLIQRIAGPRGHLSNEQACDLVRKFAKPRLKRLWLAHLSHDCNAAGIALSAMRETLSAMRGIETDVALAEQPMDDVV